MTVALKAGEKQQHVPAVVVSVVCAEEHAVVDGHGPVFSHQLRSRVKIRFTGFIWDTMGSH